jgi:hypothetical protein
MYHGRSMKFAKSGMASKNQVVDGKVIKGSERLEKVEEGKTKLD